MVSDSPLKNRHFSENVWLINSLTRSWNEWQGAGLTPNNFNQTSEVRLPKKFAFIADYIDGWRKLPTEASWTQKSPHNYSYGESCTKISCEFWLLGISLQKSTPEYDVLSRQRQTLFQLTVMSYCIFTAALTMNIEFGLFGRYNNTWKLERVGVLRVCPWENQAGPGRGW